MHLRLSFHNCFLHIFQKECIGSSAAFQFLWNVRCAEQLMLLKKQHVSQEAYVHDKPQKSLITSLFTILLLISDTFRKYQNFLKVIFSLVLKWRFSWTNGVGLWGRRLAERKNSDMDALVVRWLGRILPSPFPGTAASWAVARGKARWLSQRCRRPGLFWWEGGCGQGCHCRRLLRGGRTRAFHVVKGGWGRNG